MIPPITGRCLCGAVTYRAGAEPLWQEHCHCESCRRATASGFTSYFAIADGHWRWTGAEPALYRSSPGVERRFCAVCGTPMAYRSAEMADQMHFFAATLDHPETYKPTAHSLSEERLSWIVPGDGLTMR
ncbi:MAG: GFA family protein [Cereibacter sphaeroides]|uniref:GFA family protein n=1 Tax=Cereibacter sphaeroides TaxID=1063 RepID=A0A2W5S4Q4_CERSP|nr:MAG: GFA family protein [Cereibacter sphaeroides]